MADKDTEEKIIPVGPGVEDEASTGATREEEDLDQGYSYEDREDEPRAAGDERTGHAEEEPEGADERGLTREQKKRRKRRERYDAAVRERDFYRARAEQLEAERRRDLVTIEARQTQTDVLTIDGRIQQAENDIREAESLYVQARRNNDPEAEIEATRVREQLQRGLQQLQHTKNQTVRGAQERRTQQTQPSGMDPEIAAQASGWMRQNTWFDPQLRDEDSAIAHAVEQQVARERRFSPRTREYWDEVDRRVAKRLPDRYESRERGPDDEDEEDEEARRPARRANGNAPARKPSGPTIKVAGRERPLRKGEVFIDEERKQALIEAGKWDDEVARNRALKYYQNYDRAAGRRPR